MDDNFSALDMNVLKALYEKESNELRGKLLEGISWSELRDQRKKVTRLAVVLHKKLRKVTATMNPAESPSDDMEGRREKLTG
jgi:hypothetical protein